MGGASITNTVGGHSATKALARKHATLCTQNELSNPPRIHAEADHVTPANSQIYVKEYVRVNSCEIMCK